MSILDGSKQSLLLRESPLVPKSLLDIGWRQGALFSAPSAYFAWNDVSSSSPGDTIIQQRRKTRSEEKFVLIAQDEVYALTEEEISMADYYATRPLFLEYHTYRGEETEGAEPYSRV